MTKENKDFNPYEPIPESRGSKVFSLLGPFRFLIPAKIADLFFREDDRLMEQLGRWMRKRKEQKT